jgi:hypothetical protein
MILNKSISILSHFPLEIGCRYLPRHPLLQLLLIDDETRKNAYQRPARRDHDQDPEVELLVRPEIRLANDDGSVSLYARPRHGAHAGSARRRHGGE